MLQVETVHTDEGYQVVLGCTHECSWTHPLDAQQPLWRAVYLYRDHEGYAHRGPDTHDPAVTRARGRGKRIETLQLPE